MQKISPFRMLSSRSKSAWANTFSCVVLGLSCLVPLSCTSDGQDAIGQPSQTATFDDVFNTLAAYTIAGTEAHPLFSARLQYRWNDWLIFTDFTGSKVMVYDRTDSSFSTWGRQGEGPGEFKFLSGATVGSDDKIYTNDQGNNRIQVFDTSGTYLDAIPAFGQNQHIMLDEAEEPPLIWTFGRAPCIDISGTCLVHAFNMDGDKLRAFAPIDNRKTTVSAWVTTRDAQGAFYIANRLVPTIEVYSPDGHQQKSITLSSPTWVEMPVEKSGTGQEALALFTKALREQPHTEINGLYLGEEALLVEIMKLNMDGVEDRKLAMDVYSPDGKQIRYHDIPTPGMLRQALGDTLLFVEEDPESTFGTIRVTEALLKPLR